MECDRTDVTGEIGQFDAMVLAQDLGSLDRVNKLADISRPFIAFKRGQSLVADFPFFAEEPGDKQSHISARARGAGAIPGSRR